MNQKILDYINILGEEDKRAKADNEFYNSDTYKRACLKKCKDNAKNDCIKNILTAVYKDALPLSGEYKTVYNNNLTGEFNAFLDTKAPNGMELYVREQMRKNPNCAEACGRLLESVNNIVDNYYYKYEKAKTLKDIDPNEFVFDCEDKDNKTIINLTKQDLEIPELTDIIADNVIDTARSEITRAKIEQMRNKEIESMLADDLSVLSAESVIDEFNRKTGKTEFYQPSVFEGVITGYTKLYNNSKPEVYTYRALIPIGKSYSYDEKDKIAPINELAFIEAVKEATKLNTLNAFYLETWKSKYDLDKLALEYASGKNIAKSI